MRKRVGIIIFFSIICAPAFLLAGHHNNYLKVVTSDSEGVILDLRVPRPDIQEVWEEGTLYHKIAIPGFIPTTDVGSPQLLQHGVLLGIPEEASPTIEILKAKSTILSGYNIHSAPKPVVIEDGENRSLGFEFALDKKIYSFNDFTPSSIAKIDFTGFMRGQKVMRVVFFPFQFNPVTGELRYYSKIRVKINFNVGIIEQETVSVTDKDRKRRSIKEKDNAYEKLLKGVILNYEQIRRGNYK